MEQQNKIIPSAVFRKVIAVFMAVLMITGSFGLAGAAYAAEGDTEIYSVVDEFAYQVNEGYGTVTLTGYNGNDEKVTVPDFLGGYPVTRIGDNAFSGCETIEKVIISDNVKTICNGAFSDCINLKSVTIPGSVTFIGDEAFSDCVSLKSIEVPFGVTWIGENAFKGCDALADIEIPDSVTAIGSDAFAATSYYNNSRNWNDGVLYVSNHVVDAKSDIISCEIKGGTKTVADSAFAYCSALRTVTLPESIVTIGDYAFYYCGKLKNIELASNITEIGSRAFDKCENLKEIVIPASVNTIGYKAFNRCSNLKNVVISSEMTTIGTKVFNDCDKLEAIFVEGKGNRYSDESGVLFNEDKTVLVKYPASSEARSYVIPSTVTTIGENAFRNCDNLTSVVIPSSVSVISDYAFYSCDNLAEIDLPAGLASIGMRAFYGCKKIEEVTVPSNITQIAYGTFASCIKLESVDLPDNLESINEYAFADCTSLSRVEVPDKVTDIVYSAFNSCSNLLSVRLPDTVESIGNAAFYNCEEIDYVGYLGSQQDWEEVSVGDYNESLLEADFYFNYCRTHNNTTNHGAKAATCTENGYTEGVYCNTCKTWIEGHKEVLASHTDENLDGYCEACGLEANDIKVGETKTIKVKRDETVYLAFTPTESGRYTFYSSAIDDNYIDTYGYLCDSEREDITESDGGGEDGNFSITYYLVAGVKYYWGASFWSSRKRGSFNVTLEKAAASTLVSELPINEEVEIVSGETYLFVPEVSGRYIFESLDDYYDPYVEIYADEYCDEYVAGDDDRPEDLNFSAEADLLAGFGYYVFFDAYDYNEDGETTYPIIIRYSNCTHENSVVEYNAVAANCVHNGYTAGSFCTVCETWLEGRTATPKTAHSYNSGSITKAASCTAAGVKTFKCTTCKGTKTETIPAIGHKYDSGKITKAASCTSEGVKTYTCQNCNGTKSEKLPAIGHKYDSGKITKQANCAYAGVKTFTCYNCKGTKTESIPATGNHISDEGVVTKKATAKEEGVKTFSCKVCKKVIRTETIEKLAGAEAKKVATTSIKLTWIKIDDAKSYIIYYKASSAKKWTKAGKTKKTSLTIKNLKEGTAYKFKIVPVLGKKNGKAIVIDVATKPAQVETKSFKSAKKKSAIVTWKAVKGASGYQVTYSTSKKFTKKTTDNITIRKAKTTKATLKNLKSGKKYFVKVRAYKTIGDKKFYGVYSKLRSVKVK